MTIPFTSELKAASGNLTIPADCKLVVALVLGTTNPTIDGAAMSQVCSNGVSISVKENPPVGTKACVISEATRFIYISVKALVRDADAGNGGPPTVTLNLDSQLGDLVLGIATTSITGMTVDGTAMTYLDNYFRGNKDAGDTVATCVATTDGFGGVSAAFVTIRRKKFVPNSHWW